MNIPKALLIFGLLVSGPSMAHRDRTLPIADDGTIADIPPEYGPAKLSISFSPRGSDAPPVSSIVLSLGGKQTHLPECVTGLILSTSLRDVVASGSWYHDESVLPYYVSIMFLDPGHPPTSRAKPGYALLFNLRTSKLIEMNVHIARDHGRSVQHVPVDLASRCPPSVFEAIKDAHR